jgi:large subunit ribosomal protein L9
MDVILLKDVEKLGAEGAVVHVKPGFARNYLLPQGLAVAATPERMQAAETIRRRQDAKGQQVQEAAEALKRQLESRSLALTLNLGADGKPFGSVTVHDVAAALAREGLAVEKHLIALEQPLKALGCFDVPVRLHPSVTATVKVVVTKA